MTSSASTTAVRWRRAASRLASAGVLAVLALGLLAAPAGAHANLVSTDPAEGEVLPDPPDRISLSFDEPVALSAQGARLYDAAGDEVDVEATSVDGVVSVAPPGELTDGTYVLSYRVISADSHPISGSLSFSVGEPSETVVPPSDDAAATDTSVRVVLGTLQGIGYVALLVAAGLLVFVAWLLPEGTAHGWARARVHRVARLATIVAVVAFALLVPVTVLYQQGLTLAGLATGIAWTSWWTADGLLVACVTVGLTAGAVALRGLTTRRTRLVGSAGVAVAVGSLALVGHTRSYGPALLTVPTDVAHVTAAAVWLGGLVGLVITLPSLAKRDHAAAETIGRFSLLAGGLLAVVGGAGLVLGWRILGSWGGLVGTAYGLVLLGKVALVAVVVLVAGWNRYILVPQVTEASGHGPRLEAARLLRTAVRTEAGLLVVALLLTGFLVNQVPRPQQTPAAAERTTVTATADDVKVVAHLTPGRVGRNILSVQVQDLAGEPFEPYTTPAVSVASTDVDLGARPLSNVDSGTYQSEVVIPTTGTWTLQVSVRISEFDNPVLSLETEVE